MASFFRNSKEWFKDIFRRAIPQAKPVMKTDAIIRFNTAKQELLEKILAHPFSQDLSNKAPSPYLQGRKGTLFGFFGFSSNIDPVGNLITYLEDNITYNFGPNTASGFPLVVNIPSKDDLNNQEDLKLVWDNRAWPVAVEEGVSGLPYYIFKQNKGRSLEGIQLRKKVGSTEFKPTPFLTPLIQEFKDRIYSV